MKGRGRSRRETHRRENIELCIKGNRTARNGGKGREGVARNVTKRGEGRETVKRGRDSETWHVGSVDFSHALD